MKSRPLCAALVLSASLAGPAVAAEKIRVYVVTATVPARQLAPVDQKDRTDTVKDLMQALRLVGPAGRPNTLGPLSAVTTRDDADVVIDVLGRERESADVRVYAVTVRLTAGDYSAIVVGRSKAGTPTGGQYSWMGQVAEGASRWGLAADDAAKQISAWVKANRQELLARRPQQGKQP